MISMPTATVVTSPSAIVATTVVTVEPGSYAYEHAIIKISRAIVSVRCASIRRIIVITINAIRRRAVIGRARVDWPDANADPDPNLRVSSTSRQEHEESSQKRIL
jgi:hypothetical protein